MTTSNLWNSQSSQDSSLISSKFKATSSYSVWTPSNNEPAKSNGVKVNSPAPKLWVPPGKATISTGYRSVALPTTKKPANSSSKGVSSTSERITLPVDQLPSASENVRVTTKDKLPDGAVYETQTIDGDVIHTDTYYPAPGGERMVLERTKTTTIVKAPHHEGMGPTDDKGVPVALRTTVGNPKAWYKNMFKQIHQLETDEDNIAEEKKEDEHRHLENKVSYQSNDNRPRRVGKITEYTPSEPYVVENEPQTQNKIPAASTSMTHKQDINKLNYKRSEPQQSPVASTDNTSKSSYIMADYVKTEPKKTTAAATQSKPRVKSQEMRKAAKVKFDFVGSSEKQLTIMKNQTVVVTRQVNNDWYEGESADGKRTGIFPVAYVEILSESPQKPVRSGSAKAKFNFKGKDPKQLTVKKGDTVELLEKVDKNWYKGRMGPVTGIIPANYLEVIREPEQTQKTASRSEPESIQKPSNNLNVVHKKSLSSSSDGSSEPDEKERMTKASFLAQAAVSSAGSHLSAPKLRRGEFDIPELEDEAMGIASPKSSILHTPQGSTDTALSDMSSSVHSHAGESSSSHAFGKDTKDNENSSQAEQSDESVPFQTQRHVALYPFAPQNEDELELLAGDVVHVVEKCDDGWYVGTCERTNAFGTFPGNYVIAAD